MVIYLPAVSELKTNMGRYTAAHPVDVVSNEDFQSFVSIQEKVERNSAKVSQCKPNEDAAAYATGILSSSTRMPLQQRAKVYRYESCRSVLRVPLLACDGTAAPVLFAFLYMPLTRLGAARHRSGSYRRCRHGLHLV